MNPSSNIFLIGPMGAGKTSIGRRLAERFGLGFVDLDHAIEQATGADIPLIFEHEGEAGFRARESRQLELASGMHCIVLACGGGIVLAADNRNLLKQRGFVVYLDIDVDEQLRRLRRDRSRPLLAAPDRRERLQAIARERNDWYAGSCDLRVRCGGHSLGQAVGLVGQRIADNWQRAARCGSSA